MTMEQAQRIAWAVNAYNAAKCLSRTNVEIHSWVAGGPKLDGLMAEWGAHQAFVAARAILHNEGIEAP